jgi:hypothetical protein
VKRTLAGACGLLLGLFTLLFFGGIAAMAGASGEPMAPGILGAIGSGSNGALIQSKVIVGRANRSRRRRATAALRARW